MKRVLFALCFPLLFSLLVLGASAKAPKKTVDFSFPSTKLTDAEKNIHNGNISISVTLKNQDDRFDYVADNEYYDRSVNGDRGWKSIDGVASKEFPANGKVTMSCKRQVQSGGVTSARQRIVVKKKGGKSIKKVYFTIHDENPPKVSLSLSPANPDGQNGFYRSDVVAEIRVEDENWEHIQANVLQNSTSLEVKNSTGNETFSVENESFSIGLFYNMQNRNSWQHNGNQHTCTFTLSDGEYTLNFDCKDDAGNSSDPGPIHKTINIDKTPPTKPTLTGNVDAAGNDLNGSMIHYYKAAQTIAFNSTDATSGVDHYKVTKKDNKSGVEETNDIEAQTELPPEFDGMLTVVAVDKAGNESEASVTNIVIDAIAPSGKHTTSSPASGTEGNKEYHQESFTVTLTITEEHWDESKTKVSQNNTELQGKNWTSTGNSHSYTVEIKEDGEYTFHVESEDQAGNQMATIDTPTFILDTHDPVITGLPPDGQIVLPGQKFAPDIDAKDTNLKDFKIELGVVLYEKGIDLSPGSLQPTMHSSGPLTQATSLEEVYSLEEVNSGEKDGIYTLTVTATDKSGRLATSKSTFYLMRRLPILESEDPFTRAICAGNKTVHEVSQDLKFRVVTPKEIDVSGQISVLHKSGGQPIPSGGATATFESPQPLTTDDPSWVQTSIIISKDVFKQQGLQNLVFEGERFESEGKTKLYESKFYVANTLPAIPKEIKVALGKSKLRSSEISFEPNGMLVGSWSKFEVSVEDEAGERTIDLFDQDGNPIKSDDEDRFASMMRENDTGGKRQAIKFNLPEGNNKKVTFTIEDNTCKIDENGEVVADPQTNTFFRTWDVDPQPPIWVPILIALVVVVAAAVIILIVIRRKRKSKQNQQEETHHD